MLNSLLYENIGGKIKKLAKWIFILEAISSVITGAVFLVDGWGLLLIIFGPIVALVSSWLLYSWGDLVDDIHEIRTRYYANVEDKNDRGDDVDKHYSEIDEKDKIKDTFQASESASVFLCLNCKETFAGEKYSSSNIPNCPRCNKKTCYLGLSKGEWLQMTKEERKNKIHQMMK